MTQMHQPIVTRYRHHDPSVFYGCTCGVTCGTTLAGWRSHAADQELLNPETAVFNTTVLTPELYALNKAWGRAAETVTNSMRIVKNQMQRNIRAAAKALGPLAQLSRKLDASCHIGECLKPGTVQVVVGHYPDELMTLYLCEGHAAPFRDDGVAYSIADARPQEDDKVDAMALSLSRFKCLHKRTMVATRRGQKVTECLVCMQQWPGGFTPHE